MKFALIKDGAVNNIIIGSDDKEYMDYISSQFDAVIPVDGLDPMPAIEWLYDGSNFSPAPPQEENIQAPDLAIQLAVALINAKLISADSFDEQTLANINDTLQSMGQPILSEISKKV